MANRGRRKRRSYSTAFKRRVVVETMEPGASVANRAALAKWGADNFEDSDVYSLGLLGTAGVFVVIGAALGAALDLATEVNKYLDETAPWSAVKEDKDRAGGGSVPAG